MFRTISERLSKCPNSFFIIYSLVSYILVLGLSTIIPVNIGLINQFKFDLLGLLGVPSMLGPNKYHALLILGGCVLFLNLCLYLYLFLKPGKISRSLFVIVLILLYTVPYLLLEREFISHKKFSKIQVVNPPSVEYETFFAKQHLMDVPINHFEDFYQLVLGRFQVHRHQLKSTWKIKDENTLKSLFFMNVVSAVWGYGHPNPSLAGCLIQNLTPSRQTQAEIDQISVRDYLNASIGCCTDYANLFKYLLDQAGIKNRKTNLVTVGHVLNEVFLEGQWQVMDANTNLWLHHSWEELKLASPQNPSILSLFPHNNFIKQDNTQKYRYYTYYFRQLVIGYMRDNINSKINYYYDLPTHFKN